MNTVQFERVRNAFLEWVQNNADDLILLESEKDDIAHEICNAINRRPSLGWLKKWRERAYNAMCDETRLVPPVVFIHRRRRFLRRIDRKIREA